MPKTAENLTGRRFGKLLVIEQRGVNNFHNALWLCRCDCGNEIIVRAGDLKSGNTKSCGCVKKNDLTGRRYGKLLVQKRLDTRDHGETWYRCVCDCGNIVEARQSNLLKEHNLSCGKVGCKKTNKTHGMRSSELYHTYYDIHTRCSRKDNPLYGGRGIKVCDEWSGANGFVAFMEWSLSHGYEKGKTIDRIDVDGDYMPENCRWTDVETQARNKRLLKANKTGYAGVYLKDGKYAAQINVNKARIHLGTFNTIADAAMARRDAELKYWGWTKIKI